MSVREMKAQWSEIEAQVAMGETFEVLNRGRPVVRIIPAGSRRLLAWDNHLETAAKAAGRSGEEVVAFDREGRS